MIVATANTKNPVTLTSKAIAQIKAIMQVKNITAENYGLRIGIKGGGCSGASFLLGFDQAKPGDEIHTVSGISVYIEKKHIMYLLGIELDYEEGTEESGFVFNNPAENTKSC